MEQIDLAHKNPAYLLQLDDRGRIVLPKSLRQELNLQANEKFRAFVRRDTLEIIPIRAQIAKAQGMLSHLSPKRCLSEELIGERRKEADLE